MTDNTPLNADDELREAINQRFDVVTTQGHHQSCGEYQAAVDDIMQLILTDRKKHELQTLRYIQRELINSPKEDWLGTLGEAIDNLKQELE